MAWAWPPSSLNRGGTVAPPGPGDKTCSCSPGCAVPRECGPQPGPPLVPRSALGRPAAGSIDGRDRGPGSNGANLVPDLPPALCPVERASPGFIAGGLLGTGEAGTASDATDSWRARPVFRGTFGLRDARRSALTDSWKTASAR